MEIKVIGKGNIKIPIPGGDIVFEGLFLKVTIILCESSRHFLQGVLNYVLYSPFQTS